MTDTLQDALERIQTEKDMFAQADVLDMLVHERRIPINQIAKHLLKSSSYVCNLLRIRHVPVLVRDGYYSGLITPTHVYLLSRLPTEESMISLYEECLARALSSTQLEERVREVLHHTRTDAEPVSQTQKALIEAKLHMKEPEVRVKVVQTRIRARVTIELRGGRKKTGAFLKALSDSL